MRQIMAQHKPGLHKDVKAIFEGVWDPELDNIQQFDGFTSPAVSTTSGLIGEPVVHHSKIKTRSNMLGKQWKGLLLMPSRKKRKRKKFLSILKY